MNSQLANVKVKYIRPKYNNLKEWMNDENNIYIGRKGIVFIDGERFPKNNSEFYNPFKINSNNSRDDVCLLYKNYIKSKIDKNEIDITKLKNKTLGCWCFPEQCHGDILIEKLREYE